MDKNKPKFFTIYYKLLLDVAEYTYVVYKGYRLLRENYNHRIQKALPENRYTIYYVLMIFSCDKVLLNKMHSWHTNVDWKEVLSYSNMWLYFKSYTSGTLLLHFDLGFVCIYWEH